jgi:predicted metal-dependent HD superfamily phosphohydrolase
MFECRHRPLALPESLEAQLAAAYGEPHRAYHTMAHIAELLGWFDRVEDDVRWRAPAEVYTTILFHDAIYEPGKQDNEARSAAWARASGLPVDLERVEKLILMTASHGAHEWADHDAALFLDSDMAIVGAPAPQFAAYDAAIAVEYAHVPRDAYRAGRRAFLEGLSKKPRIFLTEYFHERLDAQARKNLAAALEWLAR